MKLLSRLMTFATAIAMSISLASCGSDKNDEPEIPAKPVYESVTVGYYIKLTEDYYKFCDVKVVFTDGAGNLMTATLTKNQDFGYTIPVAKLPDKIRFAIQVTAKNPIPDVQSGTAYTFGDKGSYMMVVGNKSDGTKETLTVEGNKIFDFEVAAENVEGFLERNESEILVGPYEYPTDEFRK